MGSIEEPTVSAIIVNYEAGILLERCIRSLKHQRFACEIVVVDNGSADGSATSIQTKYPDISILRPGCNLGFAAGANLGAEHAQGAILLFLNPDVVLEPDCISSLLEHFRDPKVGVAGPTLRVAAADSTEHGATIDSLGYPVALSRPSKPFYVSGCALATRAELFASLGGFDRRFFMFMEDVDYCWRVLLAGREVRVAEGTMALHEGGAVAPGGYLTVQGLDTTLFRVALRERNTLAMLLKCYGDDSLVWVIPAYLCQTFATAALLAIFGKTRTSCQVLGGIAWNVRQLRITLALRSQAQARRTEPDRRLRARMHPRLRKVELLLKHGMPRVSEAQERPS